MNLYELLLPINIKQKSNKQFTIYAYKLFYNCLKITDHFQRKIVKSHGSIQPLVILISRFSLKFSRYFSRKHIFGK